MRCTIGTTVVMTGLVVALLAFASTASARQLPRLKVSENKRFLVTAAGQPRAASTARMADASNRACRNSA